MASRVLLYVAHKRGLWHVSRRKQRGRPAGRRSLPRRLTLESLESRTLLTAAMTDEIGLFEPALARDGGAELSAVVEGREQPLAVRCSEVASSGNVACSLPVPDLRWDISFQALASEAIAGSSETPLDLAETFSLHSYPSASKTIYLDFDGHVTTGTYWNSDINEGEIIVTPAFSVDSDSQFSDVELERIHYIWQRVAEDFRPFAVNVTTQDPGVEALRSLGTTDSAWGIRVAIGGSSTDWYSTTAAGGVAFIDSFTWCSDTPAFVFSNNLIYNQEKHVAEAISHEVGHTLGLRHDGLLGGRDYYDGHGSGATSWAPIMGVGYYKELTQWSRGEYAEASNTEDDLAIITTKNGFGYRPDDHANHPDAATPLHPAGATMLAGKGIIERSSDRDLFSFVTTSGTVDLEILPAPRGPNLDLLATLYDDAGSVLATSNPPDRLDATFQLTLAAGTYYLAVEGTGKDPMTTGYSDYGSLGEYTISGALPVVPLREVGVTVTPVSGLVTTETGGSATFTVVLDVEPLADVSIGLSSSDASEAIVSPTSLVFTPADWAEPQTVTVTGIQDGIADGDTNLTIVTAAAISDDAAYQGWDPDDVSVTNLDDDLPLVLGGQHFLLPNTPNQEVPIFVAGGFPVSGLRLYAELAAAELPSGGSLPGPQIQTVDLLGEPTAPTIFTGNNGGQHDLGSLADVQAWEITAAVGTVAAQGLLATLTIDTTGWWKDAAAATGWPLLLADTQLGSTYFLSSNGTRVNATSVVGGIALNTPPLALASHVTTAEDEAYTFAAADFGFSDADAGDGLMAIRIRSLPAAGTLEFDGLPVAENQELSVLDLIAGRLRFRPDADAHGSPYAVFEFTVHDGMQASPASAVMSIQVASVNDPPTAADQWLCVRENEAVPLTLIGEDPEGADLQFLIVAPPAHGVLSGTAPNLEYTPAAGFLGSDSFQFLTRDGEAESPPATVTISVLPTAAVVGRYVFYNDSAWDGNDAAANPQDDAAIAADKSPLLPGQVAGLEHYTSYVGGLNGVMIDIAYLASPTNLTAADFQFLVGNSNDLATWTAGPMPASLTSRPGAGVGGSTRVTLIWAEHEAVRNQWLQISVKATANTRLPQDDVFYFGNAIGESGLGNTTGSQPLGYFPVNVTDEIGARNHPHSIADPASLDEAFDFNRDRLVDAADELIARERCTTFQTALQSIAPPPAGSELSPTPVPEQPAWLFIVVGNHVLQPNRAGQEIPIYVFGESPVAGVNFNVQIGDAELVANGGVAAPTIEHVEILTGTIFGSNHTGLRASMDDPDSFSGVPQHGYQATTTASGTVIAGGLLATVTIDTTGVRNGSWTLGMSNTVNGPTDFAGLTATIIDGSIELAQDWTNPVDPCDIDGNGLVSPLDALLVISYLNAQPGDSALPTVPSSPPRYYDVNGDGLCTAADALLVVNSINAREEGDAGEGEAAPSVADVASALAAPPGSQRRMPAPATQARNVSESPVSHSLAFRATVPEIPSSPAARIAALPASCRAVSASAAEEWEAALAIISADVANAPFGGDPLLGWI